MSRNTVRGILFLPILLTVCAAVRAEEPDASSVEAVQAIFAKRFTEDGQPVSPGSVYHPEETVYLRVSLNCRPEQGHLSCRFRIGKQEITRVSVDLAVLKEQNAAEDGNAYGLFSLKPTEPFPVSADYRADVFFEDRMLGTYAFRVVPDDEAAAGEDGAADGSSVMKRSPSDRPAEPLTTSEIVDVLLQGTAHVEGTDVNDQTWTGTAWLVDAQRRLLVTNDHVAAPGRHGSALGSVKELNLVFPAYRNGRLIHDADWYAKNAPVIRATVIFSDSQRDLALLQADALPAQRIRPLTPARESARLGDRIHSLGGIPKGSQGLWIYTSGEVRAVYERSLATGESARTMEADMQTNQGNSGGPVVSDYGELVAVVEGHMTEARSVSLYVDVSEVHAFLEKALPLVDPQTIEQFVERAEEHYFAERYDQSLADFTEVLRREPDHAYALSSRGWIFLQKGDLRTALVAFNDAIETDRTMLYAFRGRANVEMLKGEYDKALQDLSHGIASSTDNDELAEFYNERGVVHSRMNNPEAALADFRRAVGARESHAWAQFNCAHMLFLLNRTEEAVEPLQKALELDPNEAEFVDLMGQIGQRLESYEDAVTLFQAAIRMNPRNIEYRRHLASCLKEMERYRDAAECLQEALEIDSQSHAVFNDLGLLLAAVGNHEAAYAQFEAASQIAQSNYIYWYNRGYSAVELGQYDVAIRDLTQAARLEKGDPDIWALRGRAYSDSGQHELAADDFRHVVEMAPGTFRRYATKYIAVTNETSEPLRVWLQYYAKGSDGVFRWYPAGKNDVLIYEFAPGESATLNHDDRRIHGARFHIWAEGKNSGGRYDEYRTKDWVVAGPAGYVTTEGGPETARFRFTE